MRIALFTLGGFAAGIILGLVIAAATAPSGFEEAQKRAKAADATAVAAAAELSQTKVKLEQAAAESEVSRVEIARLNKLLQARPSVVEANAAGAGSETAPIPAQNPAVHAQAASDPIWKDARQPLQIGDARVRIISARVGIAPLVDWRGEDGSSKDELLMVTLTIENTSAQKKIDFEGFASNGYALGGAASLKDSFGNRYKRVTFGFTNHPKGQVSKGESIYPGKSIGDTLVFEVPIDKADYLNLELPADAVGADEGAKYRFRIPMRLVARGDAKGEQPLIDAAAEAERQERKWRNWALDWGPEATIQAKFGGMTDKVVKLIKRDGSTFSIELYRLSGADQKFIEDEGWKR